MRRAGWMVVVLAFAGCGEPTAFEELPEQDPVSEPDPDAPTPCSDEVLEPATRWTGIGEADGLFRIELSSREDVCGEFGWWSGWSVTIAFTEGRPVVGTYDLRDDPNIETSARHALGKTQATPTPDLGGRLQVLDVLPDGTIEGVLCDVELTRDMLLDTDEDDPVRLDGRFTAGPCGVP